ncbi:MAG: transglycosylase SLT domain-containing protein [Burkholderiales bacterium]
MLVAQAVAHEHGEGVPRNPAKAVELYCRAAREGDPEAQYALGWMYANGRGLVRDDRVAAAFFGLAADQGHEHARRALGFVGNERGTLPECMRPEPAPPAPVRTLLDVAQDDPGLLAALPDWKRKIANVVSELAARYQVDPRFALAVIAVESNFDPNARSEKDARGLMQLIPDTATRFNVRDAYDVKDNVRGGLAYLRWLLAYYRGDVRLVAAAYNAGEKAVDKYGGIPPYVETQAYVERIQRLFQHAFHPFDAREAEPSPVVAAAAPRGS